MTEHIRIWDFTRNKDISTTTQRTTATTGNSFRDTLQSTGCALKFNIWSSRNAIEFGEVGFPSSSLPASVNAAAYVSQAIDVLHLQHGRHTFLPRGVKRGHCLRNV